MVNSIKDLADYIGKFNTNLNDITVVYCYDPDTRNNEATKVGFRMMRHESDNPILEIRDEELAQRIGMQKGKFYCYYKPSFINGFEQYLDKDINFDYLQAYEGVCRDEFTLNSDFVTSEGFKEALSKSKSLYTNKFAS
jgi:hypothetical protein